MTAAAPHLVLAGGGLANGLIALRMREAHPDVPITVIEAGPVAGGNHTWSFHGGDPCRSTSIASSNRWSDTAGRRRKSAFRPTRGG